MTSYPCGTGRLLACLPGLDPVVIATAPCLSLQLQPSLSALAAVIRPTPDALPYASQLLLARSDSKLWLPILRLRKDELLAFLQQQLPTADLVTLQQFYGITGQETPKNLTGAYVTR